jgi:glucuronokinase
MRKRHIKTFAYPRVGLVGNPSDGYFGRTIAFTFKNFKAEILLGEDSTRISFVNRESEFDSVEDLCDNIQMHGYYGGIRLLKATIKRFRDHCCDEGLKVDLEKKFKITYTSNIPQQVGLAGSSAIITATFRALMEFYEVQIDNTILPNLIREVETRELKIPAGLQDRVVQVYDDLVFMDFNEEKMDRDGYGFYEPIQVKTMPRFYIAYRADLSEGTEVSHNRLRYKYDEGDKNAHDAMKFWAELTLTAKKALEEGDQATLFQCINANFDKRKELYGKLKVHMKAEHLEMVQCAREMGASAKFAGSGGAIVGTYRKESDYPKLKKYLSSKGIQVIKPQFIEEELL